MECSYGEHIPIAQKYLSNDKNYFKRNYFNYSSAEP